MTANSSTPACSLASLAASQTTRTGPILGEGAGQPGPAIKSLVPADTSQPSTFGFQWLRVPNPKPAPPQGTTTCDSDGVCSIQQGVVPNVAPSDPTVKVRIRIVNRRKIASDVAVVDNAITVPNFGDQNDLFGSTGDWGIAFSAHSSFTPKICMTWSASFMDSGSSPSATSAFPAVEDYLVASPTIVQAVPAAGALANLTLFKDGGSTNFSGVLDGNGCFPAENSPTGADLSSSDRGRLHADRAIRVR